MTVMAPAYSGAQRAAVRRMTSGLRRSSCQSWLRMWAWPTQSRVETGTSRAQMLGELTALPTAR